jgi:phosphoglycolate phosphatase
VLADSRLAITSCMNHALAAAGIDAYRSVYAGVSLRDTPTYPGVPEALAEIAGAVPGRRLAVATSKPRAFAEPLLGALGIADVFAAVFAPELDLHVESKTTTVARALDALGASAGTMVGDRHVDIHAAHAHGLRAVGATWGFGTPAELREASAEVLVAEPADLPGAV